MQITARSKLIWVGHVERMGSDDVSKMMLGRRPRGRPRVRFMDVVKQDMGVVNVKK